MFELLHKKISEIITINEKIPKLKHSAFAFRFKTPGCYLNTYRDTKKKNSLAQNNKNEQTSNHLAKFTYCKPLFISFVTSIKYYEDI